MKRILLATILMVVLVTTAICHAKYDLPHYIFARDNNAERNLEQNKIGIRTIDAYLWQTTEQVLNGDGPDYVSFGLRMDSMIIPNKTIMQIQVNTFQTDEKKRLALSIFSDTAFDTVRIDPEMVVTGSNVRADGSKLYGAMYKFYIDFNRRKNYAMMNFQFLNGSGEYEDLELKYTDSHGRVVKSTYIYIGIDDKIGTPYGFQSLNDNNIYCGTDAFIDKVLEINRTKIKALEHEVLRFDRAVH